MSASAATEDETITNLLEKFGTESENIFTGIKIPVTRRLHQEQDKFSK